MEATGPQHEGDPVAAHPYGRRAQIDPQRALRPGRVDPVVVLVLWAARRAFVPLLLFGVISGILSGRLQEDEGLAGLDTLGELLGALLSPLAGIAAALLIRLTIGWFGLLAAWPLSRNWPSDTEAGGWQRSRRLSDRWRAAQAYRSLRWTWVVRREAIERSGSWGRWLGLAVPVSTGATIVLSIVLAVLILVVPSL